MLNICLKKSTLCYVFYIYTKFRNKNITNCNIYIFFMYRIKTEANMSDRDIPLVPVTTLAGLTSLSDRKFFVLFSSK